MKFIYYIYNIPFPSMLCEICAIGTRLFEMNIVSTYEISDDRFIDEDNHANLHLQFKTLSDVLQNNEQTYLFGVNELEAILGSLLILKDDPSAYSGMGGSWIPVVIYVSPIANSNQNSGCVNVSVYWNHTLLFSVMECSWKESNVSFSGSFETEVALGNGALRFCNTL
jgi:hypothetical protein